MGAAKGGGGEVVGVAFHELERLLAGLVTDGDDHSSTDRELATEHIRDPRAARCDDDGVVPGRLWPSQRAVAVQKVDGKTKPLESFVGANCQCPMALDGVDIRRQAGEDGG